LVWFGLVWFGLVWFGLVWFGLVWFGESPTVPVQSREPDMVGAVALPPCPL